MFRGFLTDPRPARPPDEPPPTALAGSSIWFRSMILSMKKGANFRFQKTFENALRLVLIIVSDARSWKTEKISKYLNLYLRLSQQVKEPSDADLLFCFALTNRSLCTSFRWFSIIHADRLFFGGDRVPAPTARGLIPPNPNSRRSRARAKAALLSTNSSTDTQLMSIPSNGQTFCELQNFFSQCSPPNVTDINCCIGVENGSRGLSESGGMKVFASVADSLPLAAPFPLDAKLVKSLSNRLSKAQRSLSSLYSGSDADLSAALAKTFSRPTEGFSHECLHLSLTLQFFSHACSSHYLGHAKNDNWVNTSVDSGIDFAVREDFYLETDYNYYTELEKGYFGPPF